MDFRINSKLLHICSLSAPSPLSSRLLMVWVSMQASQTRHPLLPLPSPGSGQGCPLCLPLPCLSQKLLPCGGNTVSAWDPDSLSSVYLPVHIRLLAHGGQSIFVKRRWCGMSLLRPGSQPRERRSQRCWCWKRLVTGVGPVPLRCWEMCMQGSRRTFRMPGSQGCQEHVPICLFSVSLPFSGHISIQSQTPDRSVKLSPDPPWVNTEPPPRLSLTAPQHLFYEHKL